MKTKKEMRSKRKLGIRRKVWGTADRPRLAVFRSNTQMAVQLIDDDKAVTIAALVTKAKNIAGAHMLGKEVVALAKTKKIISFVFDRSGYRYHGAVKALAEAIREGGIII